MLLSFESTRAGFLSLSLFLLRGGVRPTDKEKTRDQQTTTTLSLLFRLDSIPQQQSME
jgi:hypothetical protein